MAARVVALLGLAAAAPRVPERFSAEIEIVSEEFGQRTPGRGLFAQDAQQRRMRLEVLQAKAGVQEVLSNMTELVWPKEAWYLTGGSDPICRQLPFEPFHRGFQDLFAWAVNATYAGERTVGARRCALWLAPSRSLCAAGDLPVELNVTLQVAAGAGQARSYAASYRFGALRQGGEVPQALFARPTACDRLAPPCAAGRGRAPERIDAYIYHPGMSEADFNLSDQNVADLVGEALFICKDRMRLNRTFFDHNYTLISRYELWLSPAYGQYGLCNGYPDTRPVGPVCLGGDGRLVGREAPSFSGPGELRCTESPTVGHWFSLPLRGRCGAGRPTREAWRRGCSWAVERRVKTIHQACLFETHRFLESCRADYGEGRGFPRSARALQEALEQCPEAAPPVVVV